MIADITLGRDPSSGPRVDEVEARLGDGSVVQAGSLRIEADSADDLLADSTAAGGGVVSGFGAASKVTSNNAVLAAIGASAGVTVDNLVILSSHSQDIDAKADAYSVALAAGTGADATNTINSRANVDIGTGVTVNARNILINAQNTLTKDEYANSSNLRSGSASLVGITALVSDTRIGQDSDKFQAKVNIGSGLAPDCRRQQQHPQPDSH